MPILSGLHLDGSPSTKSPHNVRAILAATDGFLWVCVCDADAMMLLTGGARATTSLDVNGVNVTFVSWMDARVFQGQALVQVAAEQAPQAAEETPAVEGSTR